MPFLPPQTTLKEEETLSREAGNMAKEGYKAQIICRYTEDTAIAILALRQVRLSEKFKIVAHKNLRYSVIGLRSAKDNEKVRDRMEKLRTAVGYGR